MRTRQEHAVWRWQPPSHYAARLTRPNVLEKPKG